MRNEMKRGRSQTIWRYTPGATFRYNESGGWCKTHEITLQNKRPLIGALKDAVRQFLLRWNAIGPSGYPDPDTAPHFYSVGEPDGVWYNLWPSVFMCRDCQQVTYALDVETFAQFNPKLSCKSCKGKEQLRQVQFAYICECGRIDSAFVPKCPRGDAHPIKLEDKGNFQDSYWYCKECKTPLRRRTNDGLGIRTCVCQRRFKRGILLDDGRVYYSQTLNLVDIVPAVLQKWHENDKFADFLQGAVLNISGYELDHIQNLSSWKPTNSEISPVLKAMMEKLLKSGMSLEAVNEMVQDSISESDTNPWLRYEADLKPFKQEVQSSIQPDNRRVVEYVFVRDDPSVVPISLNDLIEEASHDVITKQRLESERQLAYQLGIVNLKVIQELPILLAGVGYTRYFSGPQDSSSDSDDSRTVVLKPYDSSDKKIPIFVARNKTEALLFELDPWRLAAFLSVNVGLSIPNSSLSSESAIKAWLIGQTAMLSTNGESHFILKWFESEAGLNVDEPSALAFGVLHTISHVLKATAHKYVGVDGDTLAEYLFPINSAGLLYVSSNVDFTLGGIDSVFRSNLTQWMGAIRDFAGRCSFDPVCTHAGGACLACLYPKFGCTYFNRTLSRSFLFGGAIPGRDGMLEGYWSPVVVNLASKLREKS